ncbi:esterase, PHB depolymerase family [Sedimentisphaera cyanobacteriorum]|uniref:Esterase, PHB depolymerase family n=1 Tax=Sedimentisphaera cyanobacteriorum TaxID=1940790 RepID=A0A1Q2HP22_9BACT|nr:PHB depolymerase family esterase [Sedimentisphaera cyanobacteriorum]AQQ09100.1 esterase, PHB depolymerase family [Sedimentisphaera cyanobacteriorum]
MKKTTQFILCIALTAAGAVPKGSADSKQIERTLTVNGRERRYRVYVPASARTTEAIPVVIAFHGGGGNPDSMIRLSGVNAKSDEAGFIVVYPYGSGRNPKRGLTFNGGGCCGYAKRKNVDDITFVRAILDDLNGVASVDSERIYATGISNGAIMAYYVASELSDRIAAIAPVAGPMMTDKCNPTRPVSVIHFHGTADELAPFNGGRGKGTSNVPAFMRPEFFSVEHSINCWVEANGCKRKPTITPMPDTADDGMRVTRKVWGGGKNGSEVVLYEIEGGGHTWPGREPTVKFLGKSTKDISANDLMWEFFQKHTRKAGTRKPLENGDASEDASEDASGTGQLFESIHVPGFTDFHEGLNGIAFADFDGNGFLDALTVTTPPFVLSKELKGKEQPRDHLRLLLNQGSFVFRSHELTLRNSPATPNDFGQGWRGSQIPVVADFDGDGLLDYFVSRQFPGVADRVRKGHKPVGCSLFLADGVFHTFKDISRKLNVLNERAYNRQPSLGDVNRDGYIDIAVGADNTTNAFEGIPKAALMVYEPGKNGEFTSGTYRDIGGSDLVADFGGFHNDPARDKAGPKVSLRDIDNDGDLDLFQSTHVLINIGYDARRLR